MIGYVSMIICLMFVYIFFKAEELFTEEWGCNGERKEERVNRFVSNVYTYYMSFFYLLYEYVHLYINIRTEHPP